MKKYVRSNRPNTDEGNKFGHNRRGFNKNKPRRMGPPPNLSPYERSVWFMNSFRGRSVKLREGESVDGLMRRFKKIVEQSGVMRELKRREYYLTKTQKKKEKHKKALKRLRKLEKRMAFFEEEELKPIVNPDLFSDVFGD